MLPKPLLTRDQVLMLKSDNIVSEAAIREGRTPEGLGITPDSVEAVVPTYLYRFRPGRAVRSREGGLRAPDRRAPAPRRRSAACPKPMLSSWERAGGPRRGPFARGQRLTVAHVEARQRIGGRTSTLNIGRHGGVDVGAHWMHAPRINPLAKAARRLGVELLTADRWPIVIDGDEILAPGAR